MTIQVTQGQCNPFYKYSLTLQSCLGILYLRFQSLVVFFLREGGGHKSPLASWRTFTLKDTRSCTVARVDTQRASSSRGAAAAAAAAPPPPPHCFYVCAVTVQTEVVNMAADGMVLTNHDHQTRVGILTGKDTV